MSGNKEDLSSRNIAVEKEDNGDGNGDDDTCQRSDMPRITEDVPVNINVVPTGKKDGRKTVKLKYRTKDNVPEPMIHEK